jgi:hypothetical protein
MLNIIGFDFRAMREKQLKVHWEDRSTLFCGQSLGLDVHLFVDGGSICRHYQTCHVGYTFEILFRKKVRQKNHRSTQSMRTSWVARCKNLNGGNYGMSVAENLQIRDFAMCVGMMSLWPTEIQCQVNTEPHAETMPRETLEFKC